MSAEGSIGAAVAALGPGALTEIGIRSHVAPLFSRAIAASPARIYLANHSLGRPLDRMEDDVHEGIKAIREKRAPNFPSAKRPAILQPPPPPAS